MTHAQAKREAQRRWGADSSTQITPDKYRVGVYIWSDDPRSREVAPRGWDWNRYGEGATWEAAFADADKRAKEPTP